MQTRRSQRVFGYMHGRRNKRKLCWLEKEIFLSVSKQCCLLCTSPETESLGFIMCCIYTQSFNAFGSGAHSVLSIPPQPSSYISLQDQVDIFPLSNQVILRAFSSGRSASVLMNDVLEAASCRGGS